MQISLGKGKEKGIGRIKDLVYMVVVLRRSDAEGKGKEEGKVG